LKIILLNEYHLHYSNTVYINLLIIYSYFICFIY